MKRRTSVVLGIIMLSGVFLLALGVRMVRQRPGAYGAQGTLATVQATAIPDDPLTSPLATPNPLEPTVTPVDPENFAIEVTNALFPSVTGTPQVIYSSSITAGEFSEYGLNPWEPAGDEPPLVFVLVRGDFDVSQYGVGRPIGFERADYIAYVVDMRVGAMTTTAISQDGLQFAGILQQLGLSDGTPTAAPTEAPLP